jgi:ParB family transcriptional regulator, chromosome partitioning protein
MAEQRRGLGRGLSALLGEETPPTPPPAGIKTVPIERLHPGRFQPRRHFDEPALDALAQSIAAQGVLQPLVVRPHPSRADDFEIFAGERRWRAAQRAKLHELPVVVRPVGDRDALEFALVENVQREDLNALEEAEGYQRLLAEFAYTQEELAQRVGKSRSHVANMIRLLALPEEVKALVTSGVLSAGHARALLGVADAVALARNAVQYGMSVRQVEAAAHAKAHPAGLAVTTPAPRDPNIAAFEKELGMALGMKIAIRAKDAGPDGWRGGGELTIHYRTLDQLDDLVRRLRVPVRK